MKNYRTLESFPKTLENQDEVKKQTKLIETGFSPIRAALLDIESLDSASIQAINNIRDNGIDVDYYASTNYYRKHAMSHGGGWSYVISDCDQSDKFSEQYYNCTGIIMVGEHKTTKQQHSIMTHQYPKHLVQKTKENFEQDLTEGMNTICETSKRNSIDVIIFGGNEDFDDLAEYKTSVSHITEIMKTKFDFEPTIIAGPNLERGGTHAYFNTQKRLLYIVRPYQEQNVANKNFLPSQILSRNSKNLDYKL